MDAIKTDRNTITILAIIGVLLLMYYLGFFDGFLSHEHLDGQVTTNCPVCQTCPNVSAVNNLATKKTQDAAAQDTQNIQSAKSSADLLDIVNSITNTAKQASAIINNADNFNTAMTNIDTAKLSYNNAVAAYDKIIALGITDPTVISAVTKAMLLTSQAVDTAIQSAKTLAVSNEAKVIIQNETKVSQENINNASSIMQNVITKLSSGVCPESGPSYKSEKPPITNGLIAMYDATSVQQDKLKDLVGKNDATISGYVNIPNILPGPFVGGIESGIDFPKEILPNNYTLFTVAKYGANKNRIFAATDANWISGFWGSNAGVAYHENWITDIKQNASPTGSNDDWVLSTDQKDLYRANGNDYTTSAGQKDFANLAINSKNGPYHEPSDFAIASIIVYNRKLSTEEIKTVEDWIANKSWMKNLLKGVYLPKTAEQLAEEKAQPK